MAIMKLEKVLPRAASVIAVTSLVSCSASRKRGADAAIRVAAAGERTPLGFVALDHVGEAGKGGDERDGEPVASWFNFADLRADVFCQVRKSVALTEAALRSDVFVAAGEGDRLEADERNFLGVFHRELHDGADLIVVDVVDDGDH